MKQQLEIIPRRVDGALIHQRAIDGYVNATAMCGAPGKSYCAYSRLKATNEILNERSKSSGISGEFLIFPVIRGPLKEQQLAQINRKPGLS